MVQTDDFAVFFHLFSHLSDAVIYVDDKNQVAGWNQVAEQFFSIPVSEALGQSIEKFLEIIKAPISWGAMRGVLKEKWNWRGESARDEKSGTRRWLEWSVKPLDIHAKGIRGTLFVIKDITAYKRIEEALKKSEEWLRVITHYTYNSESWYGPDGRLIWINPAVEVLTGYTVEEVKAMPGYPLPLVHEEDREAIAKIFRHAQKQRAAYNDISFRIRQKDGSIKWVASAWQPVYNQYGEFLGLRGSTRDITKRRRAEEALRESEEKYRLFVQHFQGIAFRGEMDFKPVFIHGAVEKITGYQAQELWAGQVRWNQIIYPEDLSRLKDTAVRLRTEPNYACEREYRIVRKDGKLRWIHEFIQNLCDESKRPVSVQGAVFDVTERRQAERVLRLQVEKEKSEPPKQERSA